MKQLWEKYSARFDALSGRERSLLSLAVLAVIALLGETVLVEPLLARQKTIRLQIEQQGAELSAVQGQIATIQPRLKDPDAPNRAALEQARKEIAAIDARLKGMEKTLVAPDRVAELLEDILKHNRSLKLVALRTLPVGTLVERKEGEAKSEKAVEGSIFKHGVEIAVQGSYGELLGYLAQIERLPQQMFWSKVRLKVDEYPKTTLTLTVYTLSLDKAWLVV
jgi:MSHA biogenesis protein MshJ